jgi:hypothetical protein
MAMMVYHITYTVRKQQLERQQLEQVPRQLQQ